MWFDLDDLADPAEQSEIVPNWPAGPILLWQAKNESCLSSRLRVGFESLRDRSGGQMGHSPFPNPIAWKGHRRSCKPSSRRAYETRFLEAIEPCTHRCTS